MFSRRLASTFLLLLLCMLARAQDAVRYRTIEAMVGESQGVYRGKVVSVSKSEPIEPTNAPPLGAAVRFTVTIRVDEAIKGVSVKTIRVSSDFLAREIDQKFSYAVYESWLKNGTSILWFSFNRSPRRDFVEWMVPQFSNSANFEEPFPDSGPRVIWEPLRLGRRVVEEDHSRNPEPMRMFSMDLSVLDTPEKILKGARRFAKKHPGKVSTLFFGISDAVGNLCELTGDAKVVFIPVVPEWENIARRFILEPQSVLSRTTPPRYATADSLDEYHRMELSFLRSEAIHTLRPFKSKRNIDFLKSLLGDPDWIHPSWPAGNITRVFGVRKATFDLLTEWGVKVKQPVFEEPSVSRSPG